MPRLEKVKSGTLHFSVDCRLLFELGEKLVARKSVALAELVKNSYDADATRVVVRLENVTTPEGQIVVEDNGVGMTLDTIQKAWMRVSTDAKDRSPLSERFGRPRTGAKGIGRFASRRLAGRMLLHSVAKRKDGLREETSATFNWPDFHAGRDIDQVPIRYESKIVGKRLPRGLTLTLTGLREPWDKQDVEELQRDLFSLVSPFGDSAEARTKKDPGFSVKLESREFPKLAGEVSEKFLEASWGLLTGRLGKLGRARYHLRIRGGPSLSFKPDRFFGHLGPAHFRVHYFVYRGEFFEGFPFSLGDVRRLASKQSGVRIYLDRFRIFPYGDPGDDWLDLDADRGRRLTGVQRDLLEAAGGLSRPMLQLPGNNQLFGAVLISRKSNPDVILNISRERLLENEAFASLKSFVRLGIDWMTVQYARHGKTERPRTEESAADPYAQLKAVRKQIGDNKDLDRETKTQILQAIDLAQAEFQSREKEHISELSMIRVLATVGTSVVIFDHELRAVIDALKGIQVDLSKFASEIEEEDRKRYESLLGNLDKWTASVEQQGMQIGVLLSREARERKQRFVLRQIAEEMKSPFSRYMEERGIDFENQVPATLRPPPMYGCELQSVLLNLLTNALKAVKREPVRKIGIWAETIDKNLRIIFRDTGVGLSPRMREEVFKPFVSTSEPDPLLGIGTGLGLKIVRDLLDVYGGTVRFVDCEKPWKTCLEILLPL